MCSLETSWQKSTGKQMQEAAQLTGMLKITGIAVASAGPCTVAGRQGESCTLKASGAGLSEAYGMCVDDATGGLLEGGVLVRNATGVGPSTLSDTFEVTQVGGIPAFPVP